MRETTLPSPGMLTWGHQLRRLCAIVISSVEIAARHNANGKAPQAKVLTTFFTACNTAMATYVDSTAPTVVSRVRTAVNTVVITFSEALKNVTPANAAFVFSPVRAVTAVAVSGTTVTITATGAVAGDTVTYTQPGTNQLQDGTGNLVATFGPSAVA